MISNAKYLILSMAFALMVGCHKDKQLSTIIKGRVLQEGSLKPISNNNFRIYIVEGFRCGYGCLGGSNNSRIIDSTEVADGTYYHKFLAENEPHFLMIYDWDSKRYANIPDFNITPGQVHVRDFLIPQKTMIRFNLIDKGLYPDKIEVSIANDVSYGQSKTLVFDTISPPYLIDMNAIGGQLYTFKVIIRYGSGFTYEKYSYEIPYNDTLEISLDI